MLAGDCRAILPTLPDSSVQCCVTSPPYFGLRDYRVDGQIGWESSLAEYIGEIVGVFREVRRVLRGDGTAFLNIGDSFVGSRGKAASSLKPKDLMMVPARVAIALQEDGWWVRSEIIWHKPAPMPESMQDRPTRAHEFVFLLSKSEQYFYNQAEAREPLRASSLERLGQPGLEQQSGSLRANGGAKINGAMKAVPAQFGGRLKADGVGSRLHSGREWQQEAEAGANWRDVWTIASEGFSGAHFAVMPAELARRCIVAGSRPGDCILDPFAGAGTTGLVADRLGRDALLIELKPEFVDISARRLSSDAPLLADIWRS